MSNGQEHRECAESLAAYVLRALPQADGDRVQRHLAGCRECQAELESLRVAADSLPASVAQVEPPPELKSRVMTIVRAEAELLQAAGDAADRPPRRRRRWSWLTEEIWRPAVGLGAAAAVAAVAVVLATSGSGERTIRSSSPAPVPPRSRSEAARQRWWSRACGRLRPVMSMNSGFGMAVVPRSPPARSS